MIDDYECGAVGGKSGRGNLSDRRLSAKLGPTFGDRGCRMVSAMDPYFFQVAPQLYSRG
jgi:hypothetical protein